jgi:arylsulfatase
MIVSSPKPGASAEVALRIDGSNAGSATVPYTLPLTFTATETFDVGVDLGSPVSLDYVDRAPFRFNGSIRGVHVAYKP